MKGLLKRTRFTKNFGARRLLTLGSLVWLLVSLEEAYPAAGKNVLLIYDVRRESLGNIVVDRTMRTALSDQFGVNVDVRSEYFEPTAKPEEDYPVLLSWLRRKYAGKHFDVIVPIGSTSVQFVQEYGLKVFHASQIVYWGRRAGLATWNPSWPITGVVAPEMESQVKGTFSFIRALQPDVQHLVVVSGTSPIDRGWEAVARRELRPFEDRFNIEFLAGLTLEDVQKRLASLPQKTAVFFTTINEDGTGRQLLRSQFLSKIAQQTDAPIYSTSAIYLDTGIVGGALADQETMTIEAAEIVTRLLRGEDIRNFPIRESRLVLMANWKAMRRWNLREANLPPGTVVVSKDPSLWDTYRWHIIAVFSLCLIEMTLIVALLVQRANRRRAEKALMESEQLLQSTIDALNVRVALLDQNGTIVAANRRWKSFAKAKPQDETGDFVGASFVESNTSKAHQEEARLVSEGVRRVIAHEVEDFRCVYPFDDEDRIAWFQVRVNRFDNCGTPRLVVTQEDVTEIKKAHDAQQHLTMLLMRAQDEERRRIARDLHDVTVQNMVAIKGDLSRIERESKRLESDLSGTLQESITLCNQVIHELRTLSYLLHPPFLDEVGLVPALQWFVRGFIQRSGVPVELLVLDDIGRLPGEVETALFRVVQESLTNIHRHSGSRSAVIWVTKEQNGVVLRVVDEGHGFSLSQPDDREGKVAAGVGIQSMRQRLRQLGGDLEIESSSKGTTVYAKVSISEDQNAAYFTR
jgi:two-component system, NarL family, sensor kinase